MQTPKKTFDIDERPTMHVTDREENSSEDSRPDLKQDDENVLIDDDFDGDGELPDSDTNEENNNQEDEELENEINEDDNEDAEADDAPILDEKDMEENT